MIVLYHGIGLISRAIQWQTRSPYSHVAWMRMDGSVIESWHRGGVRHVASPFTDHSRGTRVDVFAVRGLTENRRAEIEGFLLRRVGAAYDFRSVLRFVTRRPGRNGRWFCSELVHAACRSAGLDLLLGESWMFAPGHLSWSPLLRIEAVKIGVPAWADRFLYAGPVERDAEDGTAPAFAQRATARPSLSLRSSDGWGEAEGLRGATQ